jgi:hypothetical protein
VEHIRTIHAIDWVSVNVARHYWILDVEVIMLWVIAFGLAGYFCFNAWSFLVTIGKLSFWLLRIMI